MFKYAHIRPEFGRRNAAKARAAARAADFRFFLSAYLFGTIFTLAMIS